MRAPICSPSAPCCTRWRPASCRSTAPAQGEICGAIVHQEPAPLSQLNPQVSAGLEAVIRKALEKDRNLRYQHASEMRTDLQRLKRDTESGRYARESSRRAPFKRSALSVCQQMQQKKDAGSCIASAAVVVIAALVAGGLYYRSHQAPKLTEKDTIVVADFANSTGDAVFDDTLKTALTIALNQSPFLNVLPESKVAATLKLMTRPASTKLTPEVARELCQRAGSKAYIAGADRQPGKRVCAGPEGGELPDRRHAGRGTGDGRQQRKGAERSGRGNFEAA